MQFSQNTTNFTSKNKWYESPFGVLLDERSFEGDFYRASFQGQEHDDEIKGKGNSVNYKYRMHDPRVGRFFAVDPLAKQYAFNSPYAFSENRVIDDFELEGLERGSRQMRRVAYATSGTGRIVHTVVGIRTHMGVGFQSLSTGRPGISINTRPPNRFEVQNSSGMNFAQATRNAGTVRRMLAQQYESTISKMSGEITIIQIDYINPERESYVNWDFSNPNDKALIEDLEAKYEIAVRDLAKKNLEEQGYYKKDETCIPCAQKEVIKETIPSQETIEAFQRIARLLLGPSPMKKLESDIENNPETRVSRTVFKEDQLQSATP